MSVLPIVHSHHRQVKIKHLDSRICVSHVVEPLFLIMATQISFLSCVLLYVYSV